MNDYLQYVHNLKGDAQYEKFKPYAKDAIVTILIRQLENYNTLQKTILKEGNSEVLSYISEYLNLKNNYSRIILTTNTSSYIKDVDFDNVQAIVNLKRVNSTQHPNKLLRAVNTLLPEGGIYIGRLESYGDRKVKIYRRVGQNLGRFIWICDFFINRVIPRIPYLDDLYYLLTEGEFHAMSTSEILGRLVYCGFKIFEPREINGLTYFVAIKEKEPLQSKNPSYYPIVKLPRVGKNGKMIGVYKFRTMHPYSEFLQDYIIKMYGYNDKGKPANDYRVTRWGKLFRKLWLDEFPQLFNVMMGEMKLVGLRPLSRTRFNEFPEDLKVERIRFKPGCFPPYVALCMPDDKENIEAERIYLRDQMQHPYMNDLRYFCKAVFNILSNKVRSS